MIGFDEMMQNKIIIGITTYNRLHILRRMADSLYSSLSGVEYDIVVYDDASTEYGEYELRRVFPDAKKIHRQEHNIGSDLNIFFMYEDFVRNYDEDCILVNADSDLIFKRTWVNDMLECFQKTDGVLSLFNAKSHSVKECIDDSFCEKELYGSAGVVFSYSLMAELLNKDNPYVISPQLVREKGGDISWCASLQKMKKRLMCINQSLVQHIGIDGYNSDKTNFDYGVGFCVDSNINGQILNDTLEDISSSKRKKTHFQLFPYALVPYNSSIIIYGGGSIGADYLFQIKRTKYCRILAIADKNYDGSISGMIHPSQIIDYTYDYIIIASITENVILSMMDELVKYGIDMCKVIKTEANVVELMRERERIIPEKFMV